MNRVYIRFYAELNDFLPPGRRQHTFAHLFRGRVSVKDMIESLGVPHTEVEAIIVNGEPVDFAYLPRDGDRISVYPAFRAIDVTPLARLRPHAPDEPRFILDTHLGQLATYLRMLGFDTLYRNDYRDDELADRSQRDQRILLTRDRGLLKRSIVTFGYYVRLTSPRRQVIEILRRFNLFDAVTPFRRCIDCNAVIQSVRKESIAARLPPMTRQYYDEFHICPACDRIYWKGSHYQRMERFVADVLKDARRCAGLSHAEAE